MTGVRQWGRRAELIVGKAGKGVLIKDNRIQFEIEKSVDPTPNTADIKIYNLSPRTQNIIKNEFDEIILNVGYVGNLRLVFRGNIKYVYKYKEKGDRILQIFCGDGDKDFRLSRVNETLAAGTTDHDLVDRIVGGFSSTLKGEVQLTDKTRLRGRVVSGDSREVLNTLARQDNSHWSIQDGKLSIIKVDGISEGTAFVLTSETGLLGPAELTERGICAKTLLNPQYYINGAVKLDNNNIKKKAQEKKQQGIAVPINAIPTVSPDGLYKVLKLKHVGDTRGTDWRSELETIGINAQVPIGRFSGGDFGGGST